ncbi:hypothetical protein CIY_11190 [Butyrivibrio fibrisolvens 16/4]|nr:hypothetical protein CIY_11190 [Butyrivibrio fibrisolvens 16/4]
MGLKKRFMSAMLAASMTATLFGCGSSGDSDSATESAQVAEEAKANGADVAQAVIDARKAKAEETGEYQKVVVSFFDWTGAPAGIDRINEAISEHTRETLGLDVELLIIDSAAYSDDIKLMLSSGEQVDLFQLVDQDI